MEYAGQVEAEAARLRERYMRDQLWQVAHSRGLISGPSLNASKYTLSMLLADDGFTVRAR